NCNFAILTSINFTQPFNKPTVYAEDISYLANIIGTGNVIVQRFGDLIRGRRTNEHRLGQNSVRPTLKATAGDLSLVLPYRIMTDIIDTIYALDKVAPGTANDDTLLYGCESKYYSVKPQMDENFAILDGVYAIGDGSGYCRGLSQSAAMGLFVADKILGQ
ncbi:MAG: FAD-dependent oxidoreductase, partial [Clostridia bacterium]|nr:FAD-dependent oxidoreductase [Clostridia bacterium]